MIDPAMLEDETTQSMDEALAEMEMLRKRVQKNRADQVLVASPQSQGRDALLNMGAGLLDVFSQSSANNLVPASIITGINIPRPQTSNAQAEFQKALALRDTTARQKALDEDAGVSNLAKLIQAKQASKERQAYLEAQIGARKEDKQQRSQQRAEEYGQKREDRGDKVESDLRREYQGLDVTKDTQKVYSAYQKIETAANDPSPAGDMSLIFGYMRMQDPNSTVREGEYATAENTAGIPERVRAAYNKAISGEKLTPSQRADFVNQANNMYKAQLETQSQFDRQYSELANKYGANPKNILRSYEAPAAKSKLTPEQRAAIISKIRADKALGK